jgi:ABC-2 type transport system permease protein
MLKRILSLIIKEFLAAIQDRKSRFVLIVPPLVQLFIFSYAATLDVNNVSLGILNRDEGKLSYELIERFRGSPTFTNLIYYDNPEEIKTGIDMQKVPCVLQFDETFSRKLLAGEPAELQAILDGRKSNSTQIILGYLDSIVSSFNSDLKVKEGLPPPRTEIITRNWFNPNLIYVWFTVPGLVGTLAMMTSLIVTAMTIARERELGTFDQLLVSPLSPLEILLGKTIPGIIFGMGQGTLMVLAAVYVFNIPLTGSLFLFYGSLFFFIASVVGIGLFLSSIATTQQQALLYTFIFLAPAVTLSGFATPVENMPIFLQKLTDINPLKHFLIVSRGVFLKELSYKEVLTHTYPLMLIATFNLFGAGWFFKKKIS